MDETYSFIAIPTDVSPLATGRVEAHFLRFTGERVTVHAEVTCASIVGDKAWVGSRVTRFVVEGVGDDPAFVGGPMVFRVQDTGEGQGINDIATLLFFAAPLGLPDELAYCSTRPEFPRILRESTNGNIQVKSH